ncbi:MAG: DUF4197 domain-containing protein [Acidobacteriota bacterium]
MKPATFPVRVTAATTAFVFLSVTLAVPAAEARGKRLSQARVASGLKEALSVGTGRAVDVLGAVDGYWRNGEVRIEPPGGLRKVGKLLRALGQEELVDEFHLSLNRAAEAAAPLAREVFLDAIKDMSFSDARRILRGEKHEATEYLEHHSRGRLKELFEPLVATKLDEVGATAKFNRMVARYATVPFKSRPLVDLPDHVTDAALDGLFHVLAQEEERIRTNVLARSTDLLKEVFGSSGEGKSRRKRWLDKLEKELGR